MTSSFSEWLSAQNVSLNGIRLESLPGTGGTRVMATRKIKKGDPLCSVPESAVLSLHTASNAATEALLDVDEPPWPDSAVQTLVVSYEQRLGDKSRWHPYLAAVQPADSPLLWEDNALALVAGTGLDEAARKWREELSAEHAAMRQHLRERSRHQHDPTFSAMAAVPLRAFMEAASLMASRAFFIDGTHGDALVPAADAFNHKCALVPEDDSDEDEEEEEDDDEEQGPRPLRAVSASVRAAALSSGANLVMDCTFRSWGERGEAEDDEEEVCEEGEGEGKEKGEEEGEEEGGVILGQVAMRDLPSGREVWTTYGEFGNRKLLLDYGFALADNPLDVAELSWSALEAAGEATLGAVTWAARVAKLTSSLSIVSRTLLHRDFPFDRSGEPPSDLQLLLWLLCVESVPKAKQVDRFNAARAKQRLGLPAARELLSRAIDRQLDMYTSCGKPDASVPAASKKRRRTQKEARNDIGASSARLENIARLVEGERRIWQSARAWVVG